MTGEQRRVERLKGQSYPGGPIAHFKRWYRRRTNSYAYWTGHNEGYLKGFEKGKEHWKIVADVIKTVKEEEERSTLL